MLNKKYRYIGLDFETTGLDPNKDEPIQIGIVEIDVNGKIIDKYQSLIKPSKKTDELKHIVGFITGFSIADLEHAPSVQDVGFQISKFFGEDTVVIGHNVKFDLDFLANHFPDMKYALAIDTFQLSQTLVHYAPSHALEVLMQHLQEKGNGIIKWMKHFQLLNSGSEDTFHDAMHDTINSVALFMYFVDYIYDLCVKYQNLAYFLCQKTSFFSQILVLDKFKTYETIKFPVLEKISASITSLKKSEESIDIKKLENGKKYYVGNLNIRTFLSNLAANKNIILCFSNLQKLEIAKEILHQIGIKNLGFVKEDQTINEQVFTDFLNKQEFSNEEVLFVLKYVSHLFRGYGTLDLNNKFDYQIYSLIKDSRNQIKYPIVLATHSGLFSVLGNQHVYKDYDICFFDVEWRYKSYNFFLSRPCDVYYTLNLIETLLYKQNVNSQLKCLQTHKKSCPVVSTKLNDFYQFFQILIGELFIETKNLFVKTTNTSLQHDPIIGNGDFYKTNLFLDKMRGHLEEIKEEISDSDFVEISNQIAHMFNVFDGVVNISKKMYSQSDFYFVYAESNKFTSWNEFEELFKDNNIMFFSNTGKQYDKLIDKEEKSHITIEFIEEKLDELVNHLAIKIDESKGKNLCFFVASTQKEQSKKIFEEIYQKRIHEKALLLVENITGGVGKNVFKAKQESGHKILVGGYSFLLYVYANKIAIDELIIFNINGASKQHILDDIKWYAYK